MSALDDAAASLHEHARNAGVLGAAVAVAKGDDVAYSVFGDADLDGDPVGLDTRFHIASVTKPMVATVVSRLVDRGLLDLDGPIGAVVPELRASAWAQTATVGHLLANTSGIPLRAATEWGTDNDDGALGRLAAAVAADEALWTPGEVWAYCNTGWSVLGRAVESTLDTPWEDVMRAELFGPLGMTSTGFATEAAAGPPLASFDRNPQGLAPSHRWVSRSLGPGGGSVVSTVADLVAFGRAHCDDPALARLREEQARPGIPWFLDAWCLGWARFDGQGGSVWGWDGIGSGFRAILRIVPGQRGVVALLTNTSTGRDVYRALVPATLRDVFGIELPAPPVAGEPVADLDRYAGRYAWPDIEFLVEPDGDALRATAFGQSLVGRPIDERNFVIEGDGRDRMTFGFSAFDEDGLPQVFHNLVWGYPRA